MKPYRKVHSLLDQDGIFFLSYQHAVSRWDLLYPDLAYIQYSPQLVEQVASRYFTILEHGHAFDDRWIGLYDRHPYPSLNPNTDKTFRNSSVLVLQKSVLRDVNGNSVQEAGS